MIIDSNKELIVEDMSEMFYECEKLKKINGINKFKTEKVEKMDRKTWLKLGRNGRDYVARQLDYRALASWYLEVCRNEI